jgi:hypothetical protein
MKKVIGFNNPSDEDEDEKSPIKSTAINIINKRYSPTGDRKSLIYKTSRELCYEFREFINTSLSAMTATMLEAGYKMKTINDHPHWEMYDRIDHDHDVY